MNLCLILRHKLNGACTLCSDCGTVNRVFAYITRGPWFESIHRQLLLNNYLLLTVRRIDENKEKGAF